jgi:hypothetical protein
MIFPMDLVLKTLGTFDSSMLYNFFDRVQFIFLAFDIGGLSLIGLLLILLFLLI